MVEALVRGLEGGGDNGGYILEMYSGHSLIASYSNSFVGILAGLVSGEWRTELRQRDA